MDVCEIFDRGFFKPSNPILVNEFGAGNFKIFWKIVTAFDVYSHYFFIELRASSACTYLCFAYAQNAHNCHISMHKYHGMQRFSVGIKCPTLFRKL
jgi:hypothetical protein